MYYTRLSKPSFTCSFSGVATGGARGGQSATPDSEKIAKNREKEEKNQEKSGGGGERG